MKEDEIELTHTLHDIKQMMERSSRFISLSGLSGIAAGCCALVGSYFAYGVINRASYDSGKAAEKTVVTRLSLQDYMGNSLFQIASITFIMALLLAFLFTWLRSRKNNTPLWGTTSKRLLWNVSLPLLVGGIFLMKLIDNGIYGYIAPGSLLFYGLALLNASKYTLNEIKYLGYGQIILGLISLNSLGNGLYFWALGFGVLHVIYGIVMWWKYERNSSQND